MFDANLFIKSLFRAGDFFDSVLKIYGEAILSGEKISPRQLKKLFEKLGGAYIKLGQFIASSPSLFPKEYRDEFQTCLDRSPPAPFREVESTLKISLKEKYKYFSFIDPVPLASASIAQVHKAKLNDETVVALKIRRRNVKENLTTDVHFLKSASQIMGMFSNRDQQFSFDNILNEIQASALRETDFTHEKERMIEFKNYLLKNNVTDIVVPEVYEELCNDQVITMEYMQGRPLYQQSNDIDEKSAVLKIIMMWFRSLNDLNFYHADLHGGNMILLPDKRVALLDFGITGSISSKTKDGIKTLISTLSLSGQYSKRAEKIAVALIQMGVLRCSTQTKNEITLADIKNEFPQLVEDCDRLLRNYGNRYEQILLSRDTAEAGMELQKLIVAFESVARKHSVLFPAEFTLLLKQLFYMDGWIQKLALNNQSFPFLFHLPESKS